MQEAWARNFTSHEACGPISRLYEIGRSTEGRPLLVLEISDRPTVPEPEPKFKIVANIHGNEPVGRQLVVYLADLLCRGFAEGDPAVAPLVRDMRTHLLLSMNPDGFAKKRRQNARSRDLNRDFPDPNLRGSHEPAGLAPSGKEQVETRHVMDWSLRENFTASLAFHEGAFVVNYPNDAGKDIKSRAYSAAPDDETFKWLALGYARLNPNMMADKEFDGRGITNGAEWYPVTGGMQDWNYYAAKSFDLTLEVSGQKWPATPELPRLWQENRGGILETMRRVGPGGGLHGGVTDAEGGRALAGAHVQVDGIEWVTDTGPLGDFHRPLVPGEGYSVTASLEGYEAQTVGPLEVREGERLELDFKLVRKGGGRVEGGGGASKSVPTTPSQTDALAPSRGGGGGRGGRGLLRRRRAPGESPEPGRNPAHSERRRAVHGHADAAKLGHHGTQRPGARGAPPNGRAGPAGGPPLAGAERSPVARVRATAATAAAHIRGIKKKWLCWV